jgi:hypothetical protein
MTEEQRSTEEIRETSSTSANGDMAAAVAQKVMSRSRPR